MDKMTDSQPYTDEEFDGLKERAKHYKLNETEKSLIATVEDKNKSIKYWLEEVEILKREVIAVQKRDILRFGQVEKLKEENAKLKKDKKFILGGPMI